MHRHRRARGAFACMLIATNLGGCAGIPIASRAVQYNIASEDAHNRTMLLNVLRASQRRPLEFTTLQSISSSAEARARSEFALPLVQNGAEEALELTQQLEYSERPTFSIGVLDTQEFYQGILKPLNIQTFDFYLKRDLSRRMLFDLFFSNVTVTADTGGREGRSFTATFKNDVNDDARFDDFQAVTEALINAGLTTTSVKPRPVSLGPPLTPDEVVRGDIGAKAAAGGLQLKAVDWCGLDGRERADLIARLSRDRTMGARLQAGCTGHGAASSSDSELLQKAGLPQTLYRLEKPGGAANFVLCIRPTGRRGPTRGEQEDSCEKLEHQAGAATQEDSGLNVDLSLAAPRLCAVLNRNRSRGRPLDCSGKISVAFALTPRSTYEIINYLGAVVRRADYPDLGQTPRIVAVKMEAEGPPADGDESTADAPAPAICSAALAPGAPAADASPCRPLFAVQRGKGPKAGFVTVAYAGQDYFVATPPLGRTDREPTLEAFQLLTELLALNRSAKDTPATTAFTVVTH